MEDTTLQDPTVNPVVHLLKSIDARLERLDRRFESVVTEKYKLDTPAPKPAPKPEPVVVPPCMCCRCKGKDGHYSDDYHAEEGARTQHAYTLRYLRTEIERLKEELRGRASG